MMELHGAQGDSWHIMFVHVGPSGGPAMESGTCLDKRERHEGVERR